MVAGAIGRAIFTTKFSRYHSLSGFRTNQVVRSYGSKFAYWISCQPSWTFVVLLYQAVSWVPAWHLYGHDVAWNIKEEKQLVRCGVIHGIASPCELKRLSTFGIVSDPINLIF